MSGLVDFLRKWQGLADSASVPIPTIGFNSLLMTAFQFSLVEFQGFFLSAFSGVGHIALMGFFNPEDSCILPTPDEHLSEEATAFLVFKSVNREDLPTVNLGESKDCLDLIESFFELALVKQHYHIRVVDDGLLDNGASNDVLDLLRNHAYRCPELTCRLVQVLDVLCHHGGGNGFPCLFDDKHLSVLLDTHLLDEHIHDNERNQREKKRVILDGVNLKQL